MFGNLVLQVGPVLSIKYVCLSFFVAKPWTLGLLLLDFGFVMAKERAARSGRKLRDVWLDNRPARCMRNMACAVICYCYSSSSLLPLVYQRLTELELEKRFGRIRSCYPSAQMSVGDYWRASLFLMQKEVKSAQQKPQPPQAEVGERMSENTFCATAARSFQAALKLFAMCSDKTRADLQAAFNLARAAGFAEDDDLVDDPDAEGADCLVTNLFLYIHVFFMFFV